MLSAFVMSLIFDGFPEMEDVRGRVEGTMDRCGGAACPQMEGGRCGGLDFSYHFVRQYKIFVISNKSFLLRRIVPAIWVRTILKMWFGREIIGSSLVLRT